MRSRPAAERSRTKRGSAMDAKLHTALSSALVNSTISVHRLLHLIVPRFCWLDLRLHASLYSMYGLPVSTCAAAQKSLILLSANLLVGLVHMLLVAICPVVQMKSDVHAASSALRLLGCSTSARAPHRSHLTQHSCRTASRAVRAAGVIIAPRPGREQTP